MGLSENIRFYAATDVGRVRDHNEDNFLVDKKLALFVVADGMGGHAAGEVASALAVRIIHEEVKKEKQVVEDASTQADGWRSHAIKVLQLLETSVQRACARIHEEAKADAAKRGMGTTLSALIIAGSHGYIAHVGDSRIYLLRDGKIQQVTEDHTVYNELIKRGKLTKDQIDKVAQKNAITRAVGVYERVEVDTLTIEVLPGDQFLLASDGLHGYIAHTAELEPYLSDEDGDSATKELIALANRKGGKDNITAVLVRLGEGDDKDTVRARRLALKRDVLAKMPLFSRLQERELLRIMQVADVKAYDEGQTVVREGDRGDELFIVLSGQVQVSRGDQVLSDVGPGEHFGEMALIRSMPRSATVTATEPSELIALRRADFFEILRKEHELAVKLLWQFLGVLADRLDQTSRDLSTAREELAAEDITDAIFPEEEVTSPFSMARPAGTPVAAFASTSAPAPASSATPAPAVPTSAPAPAAAPSPGAPPRTPPAAPPPEGEG